MSGTHVREGELFKVKRTEVQKEEETKCFANVKKTWFENYTFKSKKGSGGELIL